MDRLLQFAGFTSVTVVVKFDEYPGEISWEIAERDTGLSIFSYEGITSDTFQVRESVVRNLVNDRVYNFFMRDSFGDGINDGFWEVYYGRTTDASARILFQDGFTDFSRTTEFTAAMPANDDGGGGGGGGGNDGGGGAGDTGAGPTPGPTTCTVNPEDRGDWRRPNQVDRTTARFSNEDTVFGDSQPLCKRHRNYRDCTNERGEDCQWVFTNASLRKGICRVDPVAKCIENGNCVCYTNDFHGRADGATVLFHAPLSVTRHDISPNKNSVVSYEVYNFPTNQDPSHPQDENFFISKVDFTGRQAVYEFQQNASPVLQNPTDKTVSFKVHFLYLDVPLVGRILDGLGLTVDIDTNANTLTVNNNVVSLRESLKGWTCTHIAITPSTIYVNDDPYDNVNSNTVPFSDVLKLGRFSGELFDFRIYQGTLSADQVAGAGARCASSPVHSHALRIQRDIEPPYLMRGCDPSWYLPGGEGGEIPPGGIQTYGSGAFATFWLRPKSGQNVPEGEFDEEHYFQENKVLQYLWEKYLFETGMMAFNQEPYKYWTDSNEVPIWSEKFWNNPCSFLHQFNNAWMFPRVGQCNAQVDRA